MKCFCLFFIEFSDYYEGDRHERRDNYRGPPPQNARGRGRGRGETQFRGRGRGDRGRGPLDYFGDRQYDSSEMSYPPHPQSVPSRGFEDGPSFDRNRDYNNRPPAAAESRVLVIPPANRGKGRGLPTRFGASGPPDEFFGHPNNDFRTGMETYERVDSPEVVLLDSPFPEARRAPPRVAPPMDGIRHSDRSNSRDRDPYKPDRYKESERVRRDPDFSDDRRRLDRDSRHPPSRDEDRRSSRELSTTSKRDRPSDRDLRRDSSREQHIRIRRSRSPVDKVAIHRSSQ